MFDEDVRLENVLEALHQMLDLIAGTHNSRQIFARTYLRNQIVEQELASRRFDHQNLVHKTSKKFFL